MNKTLKRVLGTLALGASLSFAPAAFATYSSVIGPSSSTFFSDGGVTGQLFTGIRSTRIIVTTGAGNGYDAISFSACTNQPTVAVGGHFFSSGTRAEYYCPGNDNLTASVGWLADN